MRVDFKREVGGFWFGHTEVRILAPQPTDLATLSSSSRLQFSARLGGQLGVFRPPFDLPAPCTYSVLQSRSQQPLHLVEGSASSGSLARRPVCGRWLNKSLRLQIRVHWSWRSFRRATPCTYTKIYAPISDGPQARGATVTTMWKKVRTAMLGTAAIAVWFAVVTLGFGAHLWPLLEGVR